MMVPTKMDQPLSKAGASSLGDAPLKILVADDHALFRAGLRHLLADFGDRLQIEEAYDYDNTVARLSELDDLDLLLLDLNMPGMSGIPAVEKLCALAPDVPVIVISVRENPEDVRRAIDAGAMGYIPKSSTPEVMMSALQLVLSGGIYLPPHLLQDLPAGAAPAAENGSADTDDQLARLTPRQRDVLRLLAQGQSNKQIAHVLGLAPGTVKIHISRILRAFKVQNRTQAVIAANEALAGEGKSDAG
jgi:DNA-binding NarL/FixJ family response regulator